MLFSRGKLGRARRLFPRGWSRNGARRRARYDQYTGQQLPHITTSLCPPKSQSHRRKRGWQSAACTEIHRQKLQKGRFGSTGSRLKPFLDSGSAASQIRPKVLSSRGETKTYLPITCVHGDTRQVPARRVAISTSPGAWTLEVGLVKDLPVPVLLGRDWPRFDHLLAAIAQPASARGGRPRWMPGGLTSERPALVASDSGRDGESPPSHSNLFFDVFQQVTGGGSFGQAQREHDWLKHCWSQVRVIDGKDAQPKPHPLPHFIVQNGLLYCVAQRRGEEKQLLVVPRSKMEAVLELAHSHPVAGTWGSITPYSGSATLCIGRTALLPGVPYLPGDLSPHSSSQAPRHGQGSVGAAAGVPPICSRASWGSSYGPGPHSHLATWQGPYTVVEQVGPETYRLQQPGRRREDQLYHVNLLKKWVGTRDQLAALATIDPMVVDINPQLAAGQKTELQHLVSQFSDVFSTRPGQTNIIEQESQHLKHQDPDHQLCTPTSTLFTQGSIYHSLPAKTAR
ncbi:hypothetical protein QQF64_031309 [Cirrhinus molitorella]|uniref:Integrase p58-like C-terminal domain-containing protein n=1 Tax=Cirrhinus molitorella TaxID=172907 RepID=A0ABR3MWR9_9TELE